MLFEFDVHFGEIELTQNDLILLLERNTKVLVSHSQAKFSILEGEQLLQEGLITEYLMFY